MDLVAAIHRGDPGGRCAEQEQRAARDAEGVDVVVDHDAVLEIDRLATDRKPVVEVAGIVRVEVREELAEVALEVEAAQLDVEGLLATRAAVAAEAGTGEFALAIEWAQRDEESLGRCQVIVGEQVEPVGKLGNLGRTVVERLDGGAVLSVDDEAGLPDGTGRRLEAGGDRAQPEKRVLPEQGFAIRNFDIRVALIAFFDLGIPLPILWVDHVLDQLGHRLRPLDIEAVAELVPGHYLVAEFERICRSRDRGGCKR